MKSPSPIARRTGRSAAGTGSRRAYRTKPTAAPTTAMMATAAAAMKCELGNGTPGNMMNPIGSVRPRNPRIPATTLMIASNDMANAMRPPASRIRSGSKRRRRAVSPVNTSAKIRTSAIAPRKVTAAITATASGLSSASAFDMIVSLLQNVLNGGMPAPAATAISISHPVKRIRRHNPPISESRSVRSSRMITPAPRKRSAFGHALVKSSKTPAPYAPMPRASTIRPSSPMVV